MGDAKRVNKINNRRANFGILIFSTLALAFSTLLFPTSSAEADLEKASEVSSELSAGTGASVVSEAGTETVADEYADRSADQAVRSRAGLVKFQTVEQRIGNGWMHPTISKVLKAGDLDGNGWEDMLLISTDGSLWYYPMNSATEFSYRRQVGHGWGMMREMFGGVDIDGDSRADLLAISKTGELYLYRGTGNGGFYQRELISHGWQDLEALSLGGRAADGSLLVSGMQAGTLYVWRLQGKKIAAVRSFDIDENLLLTALAPKAAADGTTTMWALGEDKQLRLYQLTEKGSRIASYQAPLHIDALCYLFALDSGKVLRVVHADGLLRQYIIKDFQVTTPGNLLLGSTADLPANIKATLAAGEVDKPQPTPSPRPQPAPKEPPAWGDIPWAKSQEVGYGWPVDRDKVVGLGDFAPNGRSDVGLIDSAGNFRIYPMGTNWRFQTPQQIGNGWSGYKPVVGGFDFNNDSRPDLVARSPEGDLRLYTSNGEGRFGISKKLAADFSHYTDIFYLRSGIGRMPTIYALESDGTLHAYISDGKGTITSEHTIAGNHAFLRGAFSMDDFDKDGYSDLLYIDGSGYLQLARQNSDGSFRAGVRIGHGWKNFTNLVYAGASDQTTWVYGITKTGKLYFYSFAYKGKNHNFSPYKAVRPAIRRGYVAPNGYLQPTARITSLGTATNILTPGMNGVKVKIVQKQLGIWYSARLATVDSGTISAVRAFQRRAGIYADGIVGAQTWAHLHTGYPWNVDTYQAQPIEITANRAQRIERMVGYAYAQTGSQYTWGGAGYYSLGFDCSGLVLQALYAAGMDPQPIDVIKHAGANYLTSQELYRYPRFKKVPFNQRQRGDLIFYMGAGGVVQHVSIYIGDNQVIHTDWMGNPARIDNVSAGYSWANIAPYVVRPFP